MTRVRVDLHVSIDGFATTTDQTPEYPCGRDWGRLMESYAGAWDMGEWAFDFRLGGRGWGRVPAA